MITQESIDRVINSAHIEEVIGDFVTLKKRGVNLLGLCPFHQEKSPSFTVSPAKGLYKCFGCGKAGSAVGFIMEHESISFPEAIKYLAGRFNIPIEETETQSDEQKEELKARESILILLAFAQQYYVHQLWDETEGMEKGLTYLEGRGFTEEIIKKFGLGYAPAGFENFTPLAMKQGYRLEYLTAAGLSKVSEKTGKPFDFFNGRVMFPIHGLNGKVIAFAGRVLEAGAFGGKYLNSPETPVYNKREVLYGLFLARNAVKKQDECLLVEGYTDVITLHQFGVENVVASSGTSLTAEQAKLIARFTKNITLLYDGDSAGVKAAIRGVDILLAAGLDVKICILPAPEDPDSFTRKNGGDALREYLVSQSVNFVLFTAERLKSEASNDPLKKSEAARELLQSIKAVPDPIKRRLYLDESARILEMDVQMLGFELRRMVQLDKGVPREIQESIIDEKPEHTDIAAPKVPLSGDSLTALEQELAALIIKSGHVMHGEFRFLEMLLDYIKTEEIKLTDPLSQRVLDYAREHQHDERWTSDEFMINCEIEDISRFAADVLADTYILSPRWEEHEIYVQPREENYMRDAAEIISRLKIAEYQINEEQLRKNLENHQLAENEIMEIMLKIHQLQENIRQKAEILGTDVLPRY